MNHSVDITQQTMRQRRIGRKRIGRTFNPIIAAFSLLAFAFAPCVQAMVLPDIAKIVPPETIVLVQVNDFSQMRKQFEETTLYKLYKDPAMAPFFEHARSKWRDEVKKLDDSLLDAVVGADILPEGRVAAVFVLNDKAQKGDEPPVLLISQWGANITKIKEAIDKTVKKAVEDGAHRKSEDYRGLTINTIISKESETIHYCFIDDCLIGSEDIDTLKFVIAHIKGASSPTLASEADYIGSIKAVDPHHDVDFYLNVKHLLKALASDDTTDKAQTTITNLGFDNVTSVCASLGIGRLPASSYSGKVFIKVNGAKKGVCSMLDMQSSAMSPPRFVTPSAYSVTFMNLNIKKAWAELVKILTSFGPQYAAILYTPILPPTPDGQPGVDFKSGIIDHMGSRVIIAQSINKPFTDDKDPRESIVAIAAADPKALEKTMSLVHSQIIAPGNPDAKRELLGHMIYQVRLPGLPIFGGGRQPMQPPPAVPAITMPIFAFAFVDGYLLIGLESTVEKAVRSTAGGDSLRSVAWFNSAKAAIPSVAGIAVLENDQAVGEFFWEEMKKASKNKKDHKERNVSMGIRMSPSPGMVFSQSGFDMLDFSLLPKFDAVSKYFGLSAFYGISRPDGFFFEFRDVHTARKN